MDQTPQLHALEVRYGLTSQEILDAIQRRMRLRVALEGAVAEVHFERKLKALTQDGFISSFVSHDLDGHHDADVITLAGATIRVEVKTVRNVARAGPQVELQKTRTSNGDASSRFYDRDKFDLVAVCLGRLTGEWAQFAYAPTALLPNHKSHPHKLAVMNPVKLVSDGGVWTTNLKETLDAFSV